MELTDHIAAVMQQLGVTHIQLDDLRDKSKFLQGALTALNERKKFDDAKTAAEQSTADTKKDESDVATTATQE